MRVLITTPFYPPHVGGLERYSANVARVLVDLGWEVDILACTKGELSDPSKGPAGEHIYLLDAFVVADRLPVPKSTWRNRRIKRAIFSRSYDLVLIQSHLFVHGVEAAWKTRGSTVLWLNHGSGHVPARSPLVSSGITLYEHVLSAFLRLAAHHAAGVSEESAAWLEHFGVDGAESVGNAVANVAQARSHRQPGPLRVLYAGRLEPGKGASEAIDIVERVAKSHSIHLTLCGDGSAKSEIERRSKSHAHVSFLGAVSHERLLTLMSQSDLFLYPSSYPEGFPTVLIEAGAQGCAVLTFPVAGSAELLAEGGGWRVPSVDAATQIVNQAAADPDALQAHGESLRASVARRFTWIAVVEKLLDRVGLGPKALQGIASSGS